MKCYLLFGIFFLTPWLSCSLKAGPRPMEQEQSAWRNPQQEKDIRCLPEREGVESIVSRGLTSLFEEEIAKENNSWQENQFLDKDGAVMSLDVQGSLQRVPTPITITTHESDSPPRSSEGSFRMSEGSEIKVVPVIFEENSLTSSRAIEKNQQLSNLMTSSEEEVTLKGHEFHQVASSKLSSSQEKLAQDLQSVRREQGVLWVKTKIDKARSGTAIAEDAFRKAAPQTMSSKTIWQETYPIMRSAVEEALVAVRSIPAEEPEAAEVTAGVVEAVAKSALAASMFVDPTIYKKPSSTFSELCKASDDACELAGNAAKTLRSSDIASALVRVQARKAQMMRRYARQRFSKKDDAITEFLRTYPPNYSPEEYYALPVVQEAKIAFKEAKALRGTLEAALNATPIADPLVAKKEALLLAIKMAEESLLATDNLMQHYLNSSEK